MIHRFFLVLCCFLQIGAWAQRNVSDSTIATPWIGIHYGANITSGDLAERFGFLNHVGGMASFKTARNWVYGLDGNFIFGSKIRMKGLFDGLTDSYGNITDINGEIARIALFSRGFNINLMVGKVLSVWSPNENSGIFIRFGIGYLQHKLRIESNDQVIPSLELNYKKGYDRFTSGINTDEFVGYAFMSNKGLVNFYAGFYAQQGFTYNRRTIFFDRPNEPVPSALRFDLQFGVKAGWFIPIYRRQAKDYYFD